MTEAEFVKIAGREPTEVERRMNGIPKLDEAGQPMLVEDVLLRGNPMYQRQIVHTSPLDAGEADLPDSEGGEA